MNANEMFNQSVSYFTALLLITIFQICFYSSSAEIFLRLMNILKKGIMLTIPVKAFCLSLKIYFYFPKSIN